MKSITGDDELTAAKFRERTVGESSPRPSMPLPSLRPIPGVSRDKGHRDAYFTQIRVVP